MLIKYVLFKIAQRTVEGSDGSTNRTAQHICRWCI